ncbi:hypothetical protein NDU88_006083 [Pleurodeles waltl]|uniref:Uncharacterized protein n=1 Tax=Pleurodeles waltl TaxID=8319 RepID=A0AAV7NT65_PLEWA|nr:hypothetical protein NDU88_006083 [Pleurodeles waltl]
MVREPLSWLPQRFSRTDAKDGACWCPGGASISTLRPGARLERTGSSSPAFGALGALDRAQSAPTIKSVLRLRW